MPPPIWRDDPHFIGVMTPTFGAMTLTLGAMTPFSLLLIDTESDEWTTNGQH